MDPDGARAGQVPSDRFPGRTDVPLLRNDAELAVEACRAQPRRAGGMAQAVEELRRYSLSRRGAASLRDRVPPRVRGICAPRPNARRVATSSRVIAVYGGYGFRAVLGKAPIRLLAPSVLLRRFKQTNRCERERS